MASSGMAILLLVIFAFCAAPRQKGAAMAKYDGPPMNLANMRANGVRDVDAECASCGHFSTANVDPLPGDVFVPDVGQHLRCSRCGGKKIRTRPAWHSRSRPGFDGT